MRFAAQELELLDDVDELELEPPPPPPPLSSEELELLLEELLLPVELELELLLPVELELLLEELASEETLLDELEDAAELTGSGPVGLPPPQAESVPTPSRAAPPESRIKNSRRSDVDASPDRSFVGSSSSKLMGFSVAWVYVGEARSARSQGGPDLRGSRGKVGQRSALEVHLDTANDLVGSDHVHAAGQRPHHVHAELGRLVLRVSVPEGEGP